MRWLLSWNPRLTLQFFNLLFEDESSIVVLVLNRDLFSLFQLRKLRAQVFHCVNLLLQLLRSCIVLLCDGKLLLFFQIFYCRQSAFIQHRADGEIHLWSLVMGNGW